MLTRASWYNRVNRSSSSIKDRRGGDDEIGLSRGGGGGGRERGEIKSIFVKYIRKYKSLDVVCFERVEKEEEEEALSFSRTRYRIHR